MSELPLRHVPGLLALLLLSPLAAESSQERQQIEQAADAWIAAYRAADIEALMALYMPDAIVALHGQPILWGREAVRAYFAPGLGRAEVEFRLAIERIEVHGDIAYLLSKYWFTRQPQDGGPDVRDAGRSLLIYKRAADGSWKIALDIDQATPDVNFPPPE